MHHKHKTKSIMVLTVKAYQSGTTSAKRDVNGFVQLVCVFRAAMLVGSMKTET